MDEYSYNAASYGVKTRAEGKNLLYRILLVLGYLVFTVGFCVIFLVPVKMPAVIAVLPIFLLVLIPSTWRLVNFDYEYLIEHGELAVEKLYNTKKRRRIFTLRLKDAGRILPAPLDFSAKEYDKVLDFRGSMKSPDSYLIEFRAPDGRYTAVLIEATTKLVKMMSKYNDKTILSKELRA